MSYQQYWLVQRRLENGTIEIYLFNRENGKPMKDAGDSFFERVQLHCKKIHHQTSRDLYVRWNGRIGIPCSGWQLPQFQSGICFRNDKLYLNEGFYQYPSPRISQVKPSKHFSLRIGQYTGPRSNHLLQRHHGSGRKWEAQLITKQNTTVTFYDVKRSENHRAGFCDFRNGTFHGEFIAPQGSMNGQMRIQNKSGSCYFRVEEYKRPEVWSRIRGDKNSYRLGEQVKVTGKRQLYSQQAIDGATVTISCCAISEISDLVLLETFFIHHYQKCNCWMEQLRLIAVENSASRFSFSRMRVCRLKTNHLSYAINADVTDLNGENTKRWCHSKCCIQGDGIE